MKTKILLSLSLIIICSIAQAQTNHVSVETNEILLESKTKEGVKKNVVKLYTKKDHGTLVISSHREQDVQIYIFDLEGTMMHQSILKSREKVKITSLEKGTYTYTIFLNDESVEEGQLIIK